MSSDSQTGCVVSVFVVALFMLVVAVGWYKAGVQARVYQREGIEMTQWEVFVGAKPAERTVNINAKE